MTFKQSFKKFYKNFVFKLSARDSFIYHLFYNYFYSPKTGTLAYFYNELSKSLPSIYVIQVGANDGITNDPIHKFIKRDGWSGLLLEPQEKVFRNKLFPLYLKNSQIKMENIAICSENKLMDFYRIAFSYERWATGLSTFDLKTLQRKVDAGIIDEVAKRKGEKLPENKSDYIEKVRVEGKTFDFLRKKYEIGEVDVLQVDTEGFDFEVIKLYDLTQNKPKVIVFENMHLSTATIVELGKYFEDNNYRLLKISGDSIAIRNDFTIGMNLLETFKKSA